LTRKGSIEAGVLIETDFESPQSSSDHKEMPDSISNSLPEYIRERCLPVSIIQMKTCDDDGAECAKEA
jgi:hypothetical protein